MTAPPVRDRRPRGRTSRRQVRALLRAAAHHPAPPSPRLVVVAPLPPARVPPRRTRPGARRHRAADAGRARPTRAELRRLLQHAARRPVPAVAGARLVAWAPRAPTIVWAAEEPTSRHHRRRASRRRAHRPGVLTGAAAAAGVLVLAGALWMVAGGSPETEPATAPATAPASALPPVTALVADDRPAPVSSVDAAIPPQLRAESVR